MHHDTLLPCYNSVPVSSPLCWKSHGGSHITTTIWDFSAKDCHSYQPPPNSNGVQTCFSLCRALYLFYRPAGNCYESQMVLRLGYWWNFGFTWRKTPDLMLSNWKFAKYRLRSNKSLTNLKIHFVSRLLNNVIAQKKIPIENYVCCGDRNTQSTYWFQQTAICQFCK